jgi:hypothetical protein
MSPAKDAPSHKSHEPLANDRPQPARLNQFVLLVVLTAKEARNVEGGTAAILIAVILFTLIA